MSQIDENKSIDENSEQSNEDMTIPDFGKKVREYVDKQEFSKLPNKETTKDSMESATQADSTPPLFIYEHGFVNGVLGVNKDTFEQFLFELEEKKLVSIKLKAIRAKIFEKKNKISSLEFEKIKLNEQFIANKNKIIHTDEKVVKAEQELGLRKQELLNISNKILGLDPLYNWLSASLFLIVGFVFIVSDVIVSKDIIFNGMDMPIKEAWIFAIGLAGLAFIIKPAIDRVFEKPYRDGKRKKANHSLLIVTALLALLTIGLLGYFRAFSTAQNQIILNEEIAYRHQEKLYNEDLISMSENFSAERVKDSKNGAVISYIKRHPVFFCALVLSSVLFALSGAICFSIGFPAINLLIRRKNLRKAKKEESQKVDYLNNKIVELYDKRLEDIIQKEQAEYKIGVLPNIEEYQKQLVELFKEEAEELENLFKHQIGERISWFTEGYHRGIKYDLTENLTMTPLQLIRKFDANISSTRRENEGRNSDITNKRKTKSRNSDFSGYLHEQLRSMIDYNFNKQNGNE